MGCFSTFNANIAFKNKGVNVRAEFEMVKKNGSSILAQFNGTVIYVVQGDFLRIHSIFQDITQYRKNEETVQKSKEQWAKTFDAMSDIVTLLDKDMNIIRANQAASDFFQIEPRELLNLSCHTLFRGESSPCPQCPGTMSAADFKSHVGTIEHKTLGKLFRVSSAPVLDSNKQSSKNISLICK